MLASQGENGGSNQYWIATHITGSTYTIKNKMSGRCLSNNGLGTRYNYDFVWKLSLIVFIFACISNDKASCAACNSSNLRQRWQIYAAVP